MKVYCDTCVYRDAFEGDVRRDPLRPLDEFAWHFLNKVIEGRYILVTSDHVFEEFKRTVGSDEKLRALLRQIEDGQKAHVFTTTRDVEEARRLSARNTSDALHVVLALKAGALILTTQNLKHFAEFSTLIEISPPERL